MNISLISVRYAKSLFQLAVEKGISEVVYKDMLALYDVFDANPDFVDMLGNPVLKQTKKKEIIDALFKNRFNQLTISFFELVLQNRREIYLKDIARNVLDLIREHQGIKKAHLSSSAELLPETTQQIKAALADAYQSKIELTYEVVPELIGGFVLRVDDRQIDTSFSTKLKKIKRELLNATI